MLCDGLGTGSLRIMIALGCFLVLTFPVWNFKSNFGLPVIFYVSFWNCHRSAVLLTCRRSIHVYLIWRGGCTRKTNAVSCVVFST